MFALFVPLFPFAPPASAAIISTNSRPLSLTYERVAKLPADQLDAWKNYVARSDRQLRADQAFLRSEMRWHEIKNVVIPPTGRAASSLPHDHPAAWYAGLEARHAADIVLSFQTPAGGWSKNLDLSLHPRAPGEAFAPDNSSRHLGKFDFDTPFNPDWNYVGTFDNDATISELRYLARVIGGAKVGEGARYRTAFLHGVDYILAAQFPNGGWPQVWPLEGGYHDMITYNDDAMVHVLGLLRDIAEGTNEFAFVPASTRSRAATSLNHGVDCILATQITVNGQRTVWCQQHDPLTRQPAAGRNYEMPSQVSSESAEIMSFLMQLPKPSPAVVTAVRAAAAWFGKTKIVDMAFKRLGDDGRRLIPSPGSGPLWSRYYEIGTDRPLFGDRDMTVHDNLEEISRERRFGYAWYRDGPRHALEQYELWSKAHP